MGNANVSSEYSEADEDLLSYCRQYELDHHMGKDSNYNLYEKTLCLL